MKKWRSFDFDNDIQESANKKPKHSNSQKTTPIGIQIKKTPETSEKFIKFDFEKCIAPVAKEELAVHSKKIQEVELWLQDVVLTAKQKENISILLLTGPTGSGKTTTLKLLCKLMGIEIAEWVNPVDADYDIYRGPGQTARLLEFLGESKYPSLVSNSCGDKKIVLIEDFPNSVIHNPSEFYNLLETFFYKAKYSIVFICTDASNSSLNLSQTLFPQEIRDKYGIINISFNPCPPTILKNALKRIQTVIQHSNVFKFPGQSTIDAIVSSTMGDIRSAVHQFHFACLKGANDLPVVREIQEKSGAKRKRGGQSISKVKSMIRDEALGLFHSIGRVMNPKRKETKDGWRLNCNIDSLIDEFGTQPGAVSGFLQENYLKYFGDIDDVNKAADVLSQSQCLLEKWSDRHETLTFALWTSVMGLMVYNEHRITGWTAIKGPTKVQKIINPDLEFRDLNTTDYCYYNTITKTNKFYTFKD